MIRVMKQSERDPNHGHGEMNEKEIRYVMHDWGTKSVIHLFRLFANEVKGQLLQNYQKKKKKKKKENVTDIWF